MIILILMSFQLLTFVNGDKTVENFSKIYFFIKNQYYFIY